MKIFVVSWTHFRACVVDTDEQSAIDTFEKTLIEMTADPNPRHYCDYKQEYKSAIGIVDTISTRKKTVFNFEDVWDS